MHYVSAEGISKSFGITGLFSGISFHISEGDKIGLIARNGTGKSTFLKILTGAENIDDGKLWIHKEVNVVLFEQEPEYKQGQKIIDFIFQLQHPTVSLIKAYENALEKNEDVQDLLIQLDEQNAWNYESKVQQILGKLNIHDLDREVQTLSGGQKKRVALARTLIEAGFDDRHTLLLLDEPTNHLDMDTVEWLENFLSNDKITLILVTHDRFFLDDVCKEIWELHNDNLYFYKGNYENYLDKKSARQEQEASSYDKAQNTFRKELEWMRKQPKARTTKSKSREDNFYEIEKIIKSRKQEQELKLEMKMSRLGGKILELKVVRKAFGDLNVLDGFSYTFKKGEKIGIVGKNGVGKSTFLNMIMGKESPDSGKINIGETIVIGYYSQQGLEFEKDMRVIEYIKTFAESFPLAKGGTISAAKFLEMFLFPPDKQFTYLSKLSGGEKKRLMLIGILFRNPNFLILDEPTNDLDLPTLEVLEEFLDQYEGCLLLVSHDRYFMDKLCDHVFVFEGEGKVKDYPGTYTDYRLVEKQNKSASKKDVVVAPVIVNNTPKEKKKISYKEKLEFETLEKELPQLTKEKEEITLALQSGNLAYDEIQKLSNRIIEIENLLSEKEMRWLELSEMIEA